MRFSLHGESVEETALGRLAERSGTGFAGHEVPKERKPLSVEHDTRRLDEGPLPERGVGLQDPLPGLETPPCQ